MCQPSTQLGYIFSPQTVKPNQIWSVCWEEQNLNVRAQKDRPQACFTGDMDWLSIGKLESEKADATLSKEGRRANCWCLHVYKTTYKLKSVGINNFWAQSQVMAHGLHIFSLAKNMSWSALPILMFEHLQENFYAWAFAGEGDFWVLERVTSLSRRWTSGPTHWG